ncbi:hypothetical protein HAX54_028563 [Datura stramonium]|uniref:Uncharacterized protein n=1 Tax=Datura stramonium TaxID=4076 RepID=A0ABS8S9R7_DATST|nr:hypothetical protein [Datura stramonium]
MLEKYGQHPESQLIKDIPEYSAYEIIRSNKSYKVTDRSPKRRRFKNPRINEVPSPRRSADRPRPPRTCRPPRRRLPISPTPIALSVSSSLISRSSLPLALQSKPLYSVYRRLSLADSTISPPLNSSPRAWPRTHASDLAGLEPHRNRITPGNYVGGGNFVKSIKENVKVLGRDGNLRESSSMASQKVKLTKGGLMGDECCRGSMTDPPLNLVHPMAVE